MTECLLHYFGKMPITVCMGDRSVNRDSLPFSRFFTFTIKMRTALAAALVALILFASQAGAVSSNCSGQLEVKQEPALCPDAGPPPEVGFEGRKIRMPESAQEETALIEMLEGEDRTEAQAASIALGLSGNLEVFQYLLAGKDPGLLGSYTMSYRNRDGTRCLDPVIEESIVHNLGDSKIGNVLLTSLYRNLYRTRSLFDALIERELSLDDSKTYSATVKALVATNLSGLEDRVLDHAMKFPLRVSRKTRWIHPAIERDYVDYFARRGYAHALPYMKSILDAEDYASTPERFRNDLAMRRRVIYNTLDRFPSKLVANILIQELAKLVGGRWDVFFSYELEGVGVFALKHACSYSMRNQATDMLAQILTSGEGTGEDDREVGPEKSPGGNYAYRIRAKLISLLTESGTERAGKALVEELLRLTSEEGGPRSETLVVKTLDALRNIPPSAKVDVPRFLEALPGLSERTRYLVVPAILSKHQHLKGHTYLLSLLEPLLTSGDGFTERTGYDYRKAFGHLIEVLTAFDDSQYHTRTRAEVDRLFGQKNMEEKDYERTSAILNELLKDESPQYRAYREEKELARQKERERLAAEKRARWIAKNEAITKEHASPEGIRRNIQALSSFGGHAKKAARWLVITGTEILPYAHEALRDPGSSMTLKVQLINVLGAIGDTRSIKHIIDTVGRHGDNAGLYKYAFLVLGRMPQTEASYTFAARQLEGDRPVAIKRSALAYFAFHRDPRAIRWVKKFSPPGEDPELRSAVLFVAARLGEDSAREPILELLEKGTDRHKEELLLRALAELAPPDELQLLADGARINQISGGYKTALLVSRFRNAPADSKGRLAEELLTSPYLFDKIEAVRYLIKEGEAEILGKLLPVDPSFSIPLDRMLMVSQIGQLIMIEGRRMGYRIERTPTGIGIIEEQ